MYLLRLVLRPCLFRIVLLAMSCAVPAIAGPTGHVRPEYVQAKPARGDEAARAHAVQGPIHLMPAQGHILQPAAGPTQPIGRRASISAAAPNGGYPPGQLDYLGGPTVAVAQIHNVFINCPGNKCWGTVGSVPTPDQFVSDLSGSTFVHVADQYVGAYGDGRYTLGSDVIISNYNFGKSNQANDTDILNIVVLAAKTLGVSNTGYNNIYVLYFPKSVDVCNSNIGCFKSKSFCAYHSFTDSTINSAIYHLLYIIMPYLLDLGNGCASLGGSNELNDTTASVYNHEFFETVTDPDVNAWKNNTNTYYMGYEIGDECQLNDTTMFPNIALGSNKYKIQAEYSNTYHSCSVHP
jgi:hypothetical protein